MGFFDSPRLPVAAAIAGAGLAVVVHLASSPASLSHRTYAAAAASSGMTLTVESEEPGVEFAVITDGALANDRPFVTPYTFELDGPEISAVVVPLRKGESVQVRTERHFVGGRTRSRVGSADYYLQRFDRTDVTSQSVYAGDLEARLFQSGLSFTGIQFGGGLSCVEPAVWDLVLEERFAEARAACASGGTP